MLVCVVGVLHGCLLPIACLVAASLLPSSKQRGLNVLRSAACLCTGQMAVSGAVWWVCGVTRVWVMVGASCGSWVVLGRAADGLVC